MKSKTLTCIRCESEFTVAYTNPTKICGECQEPRECRICSAEISWYRRVCASCSIRGYLRSRYLSGAVMAQGEVAKARRKGVLADPRSLACADCGGAATEYDHRDYNKPLSVEPVCRGCNVRRGKAIPKRWTLAEWLVYAERCIEASLRRRGRPFMQLRDLRPEQAA